MNRTGTSEGSASTQGARDYERVPDPISNLAFDWIAMIKNKADGIRVMDQYIQDAQEQGDQECAELFRRIQSDDRRHVQEARGHLARLLGTQGGEARQGEASGAAPSSVKHR